METKISFIYANRNRDVDRFRLSLKSLKDQGYTDLEVVFVDYGSSQQNKDAYQTLIDSFDFLKVFFLPVSQLLWNKSKALNYGILQATGSFIFIADVDLIFHPLTFSFLQKIKDQNIFHVFSMCYLGKEESKKLQGNYDFNTLSPYRTGSVNGMVLCSREAMLKINGFDEFFHFYGAEDEDLFARLEHAGYQRRLVENKYFYHNYHPTFSGSEDTLLTVNPRVKNIMRINQRHFQRNSEERIIKPKNQNGMGQIIKPEESRLLKYPTKEFQVKNILAHVEHFLGEELPSHKGEIIKVDFIEDPYFSTIKFRMKKLLKKQTQPYCTLKQVNDKVLKEILFKYRNNNYSFEIGKDLKHLTFCIQM